MAVVAGASRGLGSAIAVALAAEGARLALVPVVTQSADEFTQAVVRGAAQEVSVQGAILYSDDVLCWVPVAAFAAGREECEWVWSS